MTLSIQSGCDTHQSQLAALTIPVVTIYCNAIATETQMVTRQILILYGTPLSHQPSQRSPEQCPDQTANLQYPEKSFHFFISRGKTFKAYLMWSWWIEWNGKPRFPQTINRWMANVYCDWFFMFPSYISSLRRHLKPAIAHKQY